MPRIPPELCARCKGYKRLCGLPRCPLLEAFQAQVRAASLVSGSRVEGATPPAALVGEHGYPKVNLYYMVPPSVFGDEARYYDSPRDWLARRETLAGIIRLRSQLISARLRVDARSPEDLYAREVSLALVSAAPVGSEAILAKPPTPRLSFNGITRPRGPAAPAVKVEVEENPKPDPRLEKMIFDDARAEEAAWELYRSGVDVYTIQKALSLGLLGRLRARRLVPTRWAITAVDDMLSRRLREEIRDYESVDQVEVYQAEYLGNNFVIIIAPGYGTFEWIEAWYPNTAWTRSARSTIIFRLEEDPLGRATGEDGGYSAARLSVLEHLSRRRRTGDVIILREIKPDYYAPVGNWHIRETVRAALSSGPKRVFSSLDEAIAFAKSLLDREGSRVLGYSRLARGIRRISDFL